jgi:hypothetical protein
MFRSPKYGMLLQIKQWYFDLVEFEPDVGFEFQFYVATKENKYLHLCKIIEMIKGKKITYSWRYGGYEGISVVAFELFEEGNQTRLTLIHEGLETFFIISPATSNSNWSFISRK